MKSDLNAIAQRIDRQRKAMGMSFQEFADKVGISKSTLHRYITGNIKHIPLDKLNAIANALHVTPAYLMGWEEPAQEAPPATHPDIRRLERARTKMPEDDWEKMMKIVELSFEEYFSDES